MSTVTKILKNSSKSGGNEQSENGISKNEMNRIVYNLTIDVMMIIGKYFISNNDFINIMKSCKKYHDLTKMYHFNPIDDYQLFKNMQTQHFYKKNTIVMKKSSFLDTLFKKEYNPKKKGMREYIYWYNIDYYEIKNKEKNDIYKRVMITYNDYDHNDHNTLKIENGECIIPEGVTIIGNDCFKECSLSSVELP